MSHVRGPSLCLALILLAGCAATTRGEPPSIDSLLDGTVQPPEGAVAAQDLVRIDPGEWVYEVVERNEAGEQVTFTTTVTDRHGASVVMREDDRRSEYLLIEEDGDVRMTAVTERQHGTLTQFDPPLLIAPVEVHADQPLEFEVSMRVFDMRSRGKERERGTATRRIEYVGDQALRWPGGEETAKRIEVSFTADLRLAEATTRTVYWIVPGRGIVVERQVEQITALGFPGRETERTLRLIHSPRD